MELSWIVATYSQAIKRHQRMGGEIDPVYVIKFNIDNGETEMDVKSIVTDVQNTQQSNLWQTTRLTIRMREIPFRWRRRLQLPKLSR